MRMNGKKIADGEPQSSARGAAKMISLCADQIDAAIEEAAKEINALAESVLAMARHAASITGAATDLANQQQVAESDVAVMSADAQAIQEAMSEALSQLQVGDRLSQRLGNVRHNLAGLTELLVEGELLTSADRWAAFLKATRARYTMAAERGMFDDVFEGNADSAATDVADDVDGRGSCRTTLFEDADDG